MNCPNVLLSLACVAIGACAGAAPGGTVATPVGGFRAEDRVLIGDFSRVNAIAATTDRVYVVYSTAVAVWRPIERRWEVPRSPAQPDHLRNVTRAVVDPLDRTLWLSASEGWIHYDPIANRWDEGVFAVPPARLPRVTPTLDDAMRDLPQLRALAPQIATGPLLIQGRLTAAAPDPLGQGWFIGTSTRGLVFFDRLATTATPLPLGLSGEIVGALATTTDGIWVATDFDGAHPAAITRLTTELDQAVTVTGPSTRGLPFNTARRLLPTAGALWIGSERGVVRARNDGGALDRFGSINGLPDERILALAEYRGTVVAGTTRGLAIARGDSGFRFLAPDFAAPVYALLAHGDTLWVGTDRGLFALLPGSDELRMPEGFRLLAGGAVSVLGLGYIGDTLVAMTRAQLLSRDPVSGGWTEGQLLSGNLGSLFAFAVTARGAWVAGSNGVAFVQPGIAGIRFVLSQDQAPGQVTSIAAQGRYLWIGTRAGLVRLLLNDR